MRLKIAKRPKKLSFLITAGPTREKIDPIRFISNYSTGTFGYAIAEEALRRGSAVTIVSGPTSLKRPKGSKLIEVESALEMRRAVIKELVRCDCLIMAAAVSDWRASVQSKRKIKRGPGAKSIRFLPNPDILREAAKKRGDAILVGFALETEGLEKNARQKLERKNLDLIVANRVSSSNGVFGDVRPDVVILDRLGGRTLLCGKSKRELAKIILDKVSSFKI